MTLTTTRKLQKRFFTDLRREHGHPARHHYVMLSGGVDSFVSLAAVLQTHHPSDVTALIVKQRNTADYRKAIQAAAWANVAVHERTITLQDILDRLHIIKGTSDRSLFQSHFRICADYLFENINLTGAYVHTGDGADTLYGNSSPYLYIGASDLAKEQGITKDEAREQLRKQWRTSSMAGKSTATAGLIAQMIRERGATPIQPLLDRHFDYVMDVPLQAFQGDKKTWVKEGLTKHFNVPASIAYSRKRCSMQSGTGAYELLQEELKQRYGVNNANDAIKQIAAGAP